MSKLSLFTTFYLTENTERQEELLHCLSKNISNELISKIYILLDEDEEQIKEFLKTQTDSQKIVFVSNKKIPSYGDWINHAKNCIDTLEDVVVYCNADIYLDETASLCREYLQQDESIICLSRHNLLDDALVPHPNPHWSQDLWAISRENILRIQNRFFVDELNITHTGVYRCDNKLAYLFAMRGWKIFNPFPQIKCVHVQKSAERSYNKFDLDIIGGLCFVSATNSQSKNSELDVSIMPVKVGNITKCAINKFLQKNLFPEIPTVNANVVETKKAYVREEFDIVFFGASVTKQKEGYLTHFKKKFEQFKIAQVAVGGSHIKDAGVCFLPQVLEKNPKYCFLDWFSPSLDQYCSQQLKDYLQCIVRQLFEIKCVPILLFFNGDGSGHDFEKKIKIFNFIIEEICVKYNVPYIKVYEAVWQLGYTDDKILKDAVHTNELGSTLYSSIIADKFEKIISQSAKIDFNLKPEKNKYIDIKSKQLEKTEVKSILIKGSAEVLGIFQKVGPFTGWVEVKIDGVSAGDRCLVDKHCYYTRDCFNLAYTFNTSLEIRLLDKPADYNICKNPVDYGVKDWEAYYNRHKKKLHFTELYYVGNIVEITYE